MTWVIGREVTRRSACSAARAVSSVVPASMATTPSSVETKLISAKSKPCEHNTTQVARQPRVEHHRPVEFGHCVVHPGHAPEQRDAVCLPCLEDTLEREEKPTARLTRGSLAEVGEPFRVTSSGHQAAGERHHRGNVRPWPADGLLQRFELEVGHDRPIGGRRAWGGDKPNADGDREHACEPVRGMHGMSSQIPCEYIKGTYSIDVTCTPGVGPRQGYLSELTHSSRRERL